MKKLSLFCGTTFLLTSYACAANVVDSVGQVASAKTNIPATGVYFKLENYESKKWIYSNSDGRFASYRGKNYNDQYWTIIPAIKEQYKGYFRLQNFQSKNGIYSNPYVFGSSVGDYPDQYWRIVEIPGKHSGYFKLENYDSKKWLSSTSDGSIVDSDGADNDGFYWKFITMKIPATGVYFKLENYQSKKWIYSNSDGRFASYRGKNYNDQYWTIIPAMKEQYKGYFRLQNLQSKNGIYSNPYVFGSSAGDYPDQYWRIVEIPGKHSGYFKLENYDSKKWLSSTSKGSLADSDVADNDGNYWKFINRK